MTHTFLKSILIAVFLIALLPACLFSYTLVETQVFSNAMHKDLPVLVVIPSAKEHDSQKKFPSVYLLHGHDGTYKDWNNHIELGPLADEQQLIIICPDGSKNSWYLDSPVDSSSQYETFITKELVAFIDSSFAVIQDRKQRGIAGLSMGGHGALYIASRHPDKFSVASSMSGGVDLTRFTKKWEIYQKLGRFEEFPERWEEHSVVNMIDQIKTARLALMIDCGVDDFFLGANRMLHQKLIEAKIDHDYIERPGKHSWEYWTRVLPYHLHFFNEHFNSN